MGADLTKALRSLDFDGSVQLKESEAKALWNKYDMDGNGRLDIPEIRQLCADWCTANGIRKQDMDPKALRELVRVVDKVVNQFLETFDVNNDGYVTKEEFFGALRNRQAFKEGERERGQSNPAKTPTDRERGQSNAAKTPTDRERGQSNAAKTPTDAAKAQAPAADAAKPETPAGDAKAQSPAVESKEPAAAAAAPGVESKDAPKEAPKEESKDIPASSHADAPGARRESIREPAAPEAKEVHSPQAADTGEKPTPATPTDKDKPGAGRRALQSMTLKFKKSENASATLIKEIRANPLEHREMTRAEPATLKHHMESKEAQTQAEQLLAMAESDDTQAAEKINTLKATWDHGAVRPTSQTVVKEEPKKEMTMNPAEMTDEEINATWDARTLQPGLKDHVQAGLRNMSTAVKRNLLVLQWKEAQAEKEQAKAEGPKKTLAQREREVTARELRLERVVADLESREKKLASYAEQVAIRETIVAEKEAKHGIVNDAQGVASTVLGVREPEEDKVRRELIRRKAALLRDQEAFEVELAAKEEKQKRMEAEAGHATAEGVMVPVL